MKKYEQLESQIQELLKDKVFCSLMIESCLIGFVDGVVEAIFPDKDN